MKTKVIRDSAGAIINIGDWDYKIEPIMGDDLESPIRDYTRPIKNENGNLEFEIIGYGKKQIGERQLNPLPDGAYEDEAAIVEGEDGGQYAQENHYALRRLAYPSIGDQLDALFHAGVFPPEMAEQIAAIKAKYPKA